MKSLLRKLFGTKPEPEPRSSIVDNALSRTQSNAEIEDWCMAGLAVNSPSTPKRECDNQGTRHETSADAIGYWTQVRFQMTRKDPFLLYTFKSAEDARTALLELPCIHVAEDSKKLICSEPFTFGYYYVEPEALWQAVICGDDLTIELWETAQQSFAKHGGTLKTELKPTKTEPPKPTPDAKPSASSVRFLREEINIINRQACKYRIHMGLNCADAMAFLTDHPVTVNFLYIVVETPDGNYCRDLNGIYKE